MEGWVGFCTTGDQGNWNTILPLIDPDDPDTSKHLSFITEDQATRWISLQANITSTDTQVRQSFQPLPWHCHPG